MVPLYKAVEGSLVVIWPAVIALRKPSVELSLQSVDVPAGEVAPDTADRLIGEMCGEKRHWCGPLLLLWPGHSRPTRALGRRRRRRGKSSLPRLFPHDHAQGRL